MSYDELNYSFSTLTKRKFFNVKKKIFVSQVDFHETFENNFSQINWLQLEPYRHGTNKIIWTTTNRQAITQPIDLRPLQ